MYVKMTADSGVASFIFEKENRSTAKERINYQKKGKVINMKINRLRTVFAAVLFGLVLILGGQSAKAETKDASGTARYDHAFQVLELVNQERAKVGAEPLEMDEELLSAAMLRAAETVVNFNHTRPNGERCFTASSKMSGENIAMGGNVLCGTPAQVMELWMHSSGHKANILNTGFQSIGVGCIVTSSGTYWVQCFGRGTTQSVTQPDNKKVTYRVALDTSSKTTLVGDTSGGIESTPTATPVPSTEEVPDTGNFHWSVGIFKHIFTVTWNKPGSIKGCQIQISNKKNFKQKQTFSPKQSQTKQVIRKYKGKKLKAGKDYFIRVRAYTVSNGKKVYGQWTRLRCLA